MKKKALATLQDKAVQTEPLSPPPSPSPTPVYPSRIARDQARTARKAERRRLANAKNPGTYVWCPVCCLEVLARGHEGHCLCN